MATKAEAIRKWYISANLQVAAVAAGYLSALREAEDMTRKSASAGPVCVAAGKWKGERKTPVLTSADGRERMYGWVEWDRSTFGKRGGDREHALRTEAAV